MVEGLPRLSPVRVRSAAGGEARDLGVTVYAARRWWPRLRGLLGRPALAAEEGLLLSPCGQVHTFGMRYALDVVYLDRGERVVKCVAGLRPNRVSGSWRGWQVLELAAGGLKRTGLRVGDRLLWRLPSSEVD